MTGPVVILIEDDDALRDATAQGLELAGLAVRAFSRAEPALELVSEAFDGMVVSDIRLPGIDGMVLLARVRARDPELPVILITGHGDVPLAVAALKQGATDFLPKPFAIDHLVAGIRRALDHRSLVIENRRLRRALHEAGAAEPLIGVSPAMVRLRAAVARLADADVDVLVEGETGTGKDLVAALLHRLGRRCRRPLVTVECAGLTHATAEFDLFGHAGDSVPHTRLAREGLIAGSSGGTLLLDAVDALPPAMQHKLLRVIEDREVQPVGAPRAVAIDLRVVATSRLPLAAEVAAGRFSRALHDRLALTRLSVPPLREREGDRLLLFAAFVGEAEAAVGRSGRGPDAAARDRVLAYDWPGNVRELRNFAFQTVLGPPVEEAAGEAPDLRRRMADFESAVIVEALRASRGNVARAIGRLGVPRKTFYDKVARHGIDIARFRRDRHEPSGEGPVREEEA